MKLISLDYCTSQGGIENNIELDKYNNDPHDGNWRFGLFHFQKE